MRVTIEHYIATNNPNQAQAVLAKYGLRAKNMPDLIRKMHKLMKVKGEEAVKDFASINTPYKQLLISTITPIQSTPVAETATVEKKSSACGCSSSADGSEESSNACGCSGANGEETSGCDGCGGKCGGKNKTATSNVEGDKKPNTPAPVTEPKAEQKAETKETPAPVKIEKEKTDMMPFVIVGAVALIAVVVISKS